MPERMQDFADMLRAALGPRLRRDSTDFLSMLAQDAMMEFPFAPPGLPQRLEGRDAVAKHLARLGELISFDSIGPARVAAASGDTTVMEFGATGRGLATGGGVYRQRYISVIETRDGRIICYRDYWNPLALMQALLGEPSSERQDVGAAYRG